jgi:hypothetical protein
MASTPRLSVTRRNALPTSLHRLLHQFLRGCLADAAADVDAIAAKNGDWRLQNTVQVWVPCGLALPSKEVFVREVAQGILAGLTWEKFKVYERSRWFGAEQAVSGIALVQACHGLLLPSFARFVQAQQRQREVITESGSGRIAVI